MSDQPAFGAKPTASTSSAITPSSAHTRRGCPNVSGQLQPSQRPPHLEGVSHSTGPQARAEAIYDNYLSAQARSQAAALSSSSLPGLEETHHAPTQQEKSERSLLGLHGCHWGIWALNAAALCLVAVPSQPGRRPFAVDLEECVSCAEVVRLLCQAARTEWLTNEDLGNLLRALDEVSGGVAGEAVPARAGSYASH